MRVYSFNTFDPIQLSLGTGQTIVSVGDLVKYSIDKVKLQRRVKCVPFWDAETPIHPSSGYNMYEKTSINLRAHVAGPA